MTSLEMLWESDDPSMVLGDRFGHQDANSVVAWLRVVLVHDYRRERQSWERLVMSDCDGGEGAWLRKPGS